MLTIEIKEDSQEKLVSVQGKPTKYYLFSEEFNAIVQKINEVYLGQNPNRITGLGTETVEGNQYTYQGYSWIINGADLDNIDTPSVIVIPTASVGFRRKDISVFNEFGNIVRVAGTETDGDIATTPDIPENTIYFRTYDVVGDVITSDDTPPFVGIEYKTKRESDSYVYTNDGDNVILPIPSEGQMHLIVDNEDLISIDGFDKTLLMLVRNSEYPYEGKDYLFENKSPNPVQLNNLTSAVIPIELGANLTVPSGGKIWFKYKSDVLLLVMKSWNDPVDLSTKADLVGGKVPAEQLPAYVDDVLEFANFSSFPTTGETGIIYVALDKNFTYRWSGSVYVQIGGGKRYQTLLFQSSATVTLPADQKNLHQSRFTAGSSVFSTLGLTLGVGILEPGGVLDLSYMSDACVPNITPNYTSKVVNVTLSYSRNVAESGANTNVKIRLISESKYLTDVQKICEYVITSSTLLPNNEGKVIIPILTHLPLSAHSNLKWTIRSNNGVAQQFNILRLNVDIEEI